MVGIYALVHLPACGGGGTASSAPAVVVDDSITSSHCVLTVSYPAEAVVDFGEMRFDYTDVVGNFGESGHGARCRGLVEDATRFEAVNNC